MLINLIEILKTFFFFKTSYSNNVFPDPLNKEEEENIKKERMQAQIFFNNWYRATKKHFENKE